MKEKLVPREAALPDPKPAWGKPNESSPDDVISWIEFTENTTFHGVKYIFDNKPYGIRRAIWFVCVMAAVIVFACASFTRLFDFLEHESTVNLEMVYNKPLEFPAVTICNQNSFRLTKAVDYDVYEYIDEFLSFEEDAYLDRYGNLSHVDLASFVLDSAHRKEDFIDDCTWRRRPCRDFFRRVVTDAGVCYTFNPPGTDRTVHNPGSRFGLHLVLNVEQYEYMKGFQNDVGVKVVLHNGTERPLVRDQGFVVEPGKHILVAITRKEIQSLEKPYGQCVEGAEPLSNCQLQCQGEAIKERCNCTNIYMAENMSDPTICSLRKEFECVQKYEMESVQKYCNCSLPCDRTNFEPRPSSALLSKYNINRVALSNNDRRMDANKKFLRARDISQKAIKAILGEDRKRMSTVRELGTKLSDLLVAYGDKLKDAASLAKSVGVPNILDSPLREHFTDVTPVVDGIFKRRQKQFMDLPDEPNFHMVRFAIDRMSLLFTGNTPMLALLTECMDSGVFQPDQRFHGRPSDGEPDQSICPPPTEPPHEQRPLDGPGPSPHHPPPKPSQESHQPQKRDLENDSTEGQLTPMEFVDHDNLKDTSYKTKRDFNDHSDLQWDRESMDGLQGDDNISLDNQGPIEDDISLSGMDQKSHKAYTFLKLIFKRQLEGEYNGDSSSDYSGDSGYGGESAYSNLSSDYSSDSGYTGAGLNSDVSSSYYNPDYSSYNQSPHLSYPSYYSPHYSSYDQSSYGSYSSYSVSSYSSGQNSYHSSLYYPSSNYASYSSPDLSNYFSSSGYRSSYYDSYTSFNPTYTPGYPSYGSSYTGSGPFTSMGTPYTTEDPTTEPFVSETTFAPEATTFAPADSTTYNPEATTYDPEATTTGLWTTSSDSTIDSSPSTCIPIEAGSFASGIPVMAAIEPSCITLYTSSSVYTFKHLTSSSQIYYGYSSNPYGSYPYGPHHHGSSRPPFPSNRFPPDFGPPEHSGDEQNEEGSGFGADNDDWLNEHDQEEGESLGPTLPPDIVDKCDVIKYLACHPVRGGPDPEEKDRALEKQVKGFRAWYMHTVAEIFDNIEEDYNNTIFHRNCLTELDDLDKVLPNIGRVFIMANAVKRAETVQQLHDALEVFANSTEMVRKFKSDAKEVDLVKCMWFKKYWLGLHGKNSKAKDDMEIHIQSVEQANLNLMSQSMEIRSLGSELSTMYIHLNSKAIPNFKHLKEYQNNKFYKTKLVQKYDQFQMQTAMASLKNEMDEFKGRVRTIYQTLRNVETGMAIWYGDIMNKMVVPLIKAAEIDQLPIVWVTANTTFTQHIVLNESLDLYSTKVSQIPEHVFGPIKQIIRKAEEDISGVLSELLVAEKELRESFETYDKDNTMDDDFFMNNFLQLDLYYTELSYQTVKSNVAFTWVSLLSEVGGFMGLLLGASVLTVCEIIDYAFLQCLSRCRH